MAMTPESPAPQKDAPGWLFLPRVVGYALGGLCVGAVNGYVFLLYFISAERFIGLAALLGLKLEIADKIWLAPSLGAVIGVVAGVAGGSIMDARAARRNKDFAQTAERLGYHVSSATPDLDDRLRSDFPSLKAGMSNVVLKEVPGIRLVVGDLVTTSEYGSGIESKTRSQTQTAAYYAAEALHLPRFTLQPSNILLSRMLRASGMEGMEFPAHPQFSRSYYLSAVHVENVRAVFSEQLLALLVAGPGFYIASAPDALIIYRPGIVCSAAELEGFIAGTRQIFDLFAASARQASVKAETVLTAKEDMRAFADKMPGLMGKMVRESLVTRAEMERFLGQPQPRGIPANLERYCDAWAPWMAILVGILFALGGALIASFFAAIGDWAAAIIGLIFFAIGAPVAFFFARIRLRLRRLLRHGQLGVGRIEGIESTGWSTGNIGEVFRLTVRYQAGVQAVLANCRISAQAARQAQELAAGKKPAPILYDASYPQHILFVGELVNEQRLADS